MVGLPMACGLSAKTYYEKMLRDGIPLLSNELVYPNYQGSEETNQRIETIFDFLRDYNLLEPKLLEVLEELMKDEDAQS